MHVQKIWGGGWFWKHGRFETCFGLIGVFCPLRNIKDLNNEREVMVIKYAEDTKQRGSASTLEYRIRK